MTIPTAGPSAHRLRDALGAPRESVAYAHDAQFHATVELVCQLLDVIDTIVNGDTARRITDEFARLLSTEHAAQAHQRIRELDEQIAQSRLFGRQARMWDGGSGGPPPRRLSPAAEVMSGYHGPRDITPQHHQYGRECPNYPHGCRICVPVHDITVHEHPHEHSGLRHVHHHRHPVRQHVSDDFIAQVQAVLDAGTYQILPSGTEVIPYRDMIENLASINELLAELTAREADDIEFSRMARDVLRRHSWRLGMQFQGQMGDPDAPAIQERASGVPEDAAGDRPDPEDVRGPVPAAEPSGRDEGSAEHPAGPGT